jgi:transposase
MAKQLSTSQSCLRNWGLQADADDNADRSPRLTSDEKHELAELRREKRRLEIEN